MKKSRTRQLGWTSLASLALAVSFALTSCSSNSGKTSQLSLTMPDWSSFAKVKAAGTGNSGGASGGSTGTTPTTPVAVTYTLSRLMINVTGGTLSAPMVTIWDAGQVNATSLPPTTLNFQVAKGGVGLVQVLAILSPSSSSNNGANGILLYGDQSAAFDSDIVNVGVQLAVVQQTQGLAQGVIGGRYLNADGLNGPTGIVDIKYEPGSGRPAMIVTQSEMHGGWFEFTAFESLNFTYTLRNSKDLFSNFNLDNFSLLSGVQNMAVSIPAAYQQNNGSYSLGTPSKYQLGFFGPGVNGQSICYDSLATDSIPNLYSDAAGDPMPWAGSTAPNSSQAGVVTGGRSAANASCLPTATLGLTWLRFDQTQLQGGGHGTLGFQGPFTKLSDGNLMDASASGTNAVTVNFSLLPGTVGVGRMTGVGVFTRTVANTANSNGNKDYQIDDGIACNRLTDSSFLSSPFTFQSRVPVTSAGAQSLTIPNLSSAGLANGQLQIILCPSLDANSPYYTLGIDYSGQNSGASSYDLSITNPNGHLTQLVNTCTPYKVNTVMNGVPVTASVTQTFTVNVMNSSTALLSLNPDCSNSSTTLNSSIVAGTPSTTIYMTDSTPTMDSINVVFSNNYSRSLSVAVAQARTSGIISLTIPQPATAGSYSLSTNLCYPVDILMSYGGGPAVTSSGSIVYNLTFGDSSTLIYSDSSCSTTMSSAQVIFDTQTSYNRVYIRGGTAVSSSNLQALQVGNTSGYSTGSSIGYSMASSAAATLQVGLSNYTNGTTPLLYYPTNSCQQMTLGYFSSNGAPAPAPAQQSITLSGALFYNNATCSGSGSATYTATINPSILPNAISSSPFFVKFGSATSTLLTYGISGAGNLTTNLNAQPDSIALQVQSGNSVGTYVRNTCSGLQISSLTSGNQTVLSVPSVLNLSSTDGGTYYYSDSYCMVPISSVSFGAGVPINTLVYMNAGNFSTTPVANLVGSNLTSTYNQFNAIPFSAFPSVTTTAGSIPSVLTPSTCYQFRFSNSSASTTVTLALIDTSMLTSLSGNYLYSNSTCTTALTGGGATAMTAPLMFTAGQSLNSSVYIKTGTVAPTLVPVKFTESSSGDTFYYEAIFPGP